MGNSTLQPEILCQRNKCSRTSCHSESHVLWVFMTLRIARVVDFAGLFANETQASDESIEDVTAAVKQPLSNTPHSTVALVCKATTGNTAKCDEQQIQRNASLDGRPCQRRLLKILRFLVRHFAPTVPRTPPGIECQLCAITGQILHKRHRTIVPIRHIDKIIHGARLKSSISSFL